jgi:tetratricopeptide (TPR) repeat protein
MSGRTMVLLLLLAAGGGTVGAGMPPASRARAERLDVWRVELADAQRALAQGRAEDAARAYSGVLAEARKLGDAGLLAARATDGLADARREQSRFDDAARLYREAAAMWERLLGPRQPRLATTLHQLGVMEWRLGRRDEASRHLSRALAVFESAFGADSPEACNTRRALERLDEDYEAGATGTR